MYKTIAGKVKRLIEFSRSSTLNRKLFLEIILSVILTLSALFIFFKIVDELLEKDILHFDVWLINVAYAFRSPTMTEFMFFLTFLGSPLFLLTLSVIMVLYLFTKRRRDAIIYLGILYSGVLLNLILKYTFARPRPQFHPLVHENLFSFPSGHAMNSFVFYMALSYFIFRETKNVKFTIFVTIISVLIIIGVGISRVYLGVHYPSDVIAGYVAGFIWIVSAILFEKLVIFERLYKSSK